MPFKIINGFSEIWDQYEGYVVDLWGVIHNGHTLYPNVLECLKALKERGKKVVFLSNAPRRSKVVKEFLLSLGLPSHLYTGIVTSGDETFEEMQVSYMPHFGNKVFFLRRLDRDRDMHMLEIEGLKEVKTLEEADFILGVDIYHMEDSLETYQPLLEEGCQKNLPFVCANPDFIVHIGSQMIICPGTLAAWYASKGGPVFYHGKPYLSIYRRALSLLGGIDERHILGIGDALQTDIKGALNAGIDSALIFKGIHREEMKEEEEISLENKLEKLFNLYQIYPTFALAEFKI